MLQDPSVWFSSLKILAALLLILLNGLFTAAEFSFVRVRPTRIAQLVEEGNKRAAKVQDCIHNINAYLSVSQLGITLASLGLGWLGEPAVASLISPLLASLGLRSGTLLTSISFVIAFLLISFMHVVFGELTPKSLAIQKTESMALRLAGPMRSFYYIFYPAAAVLNVSARQVTRFLGFRADSDHELSHSEEELRMIIAESYHGGQINETEQELLQNVFRFEERVAEEIMVPRPDVVFLDTKLSLEQNLERVQETGHTRFPLIEGNPDEVIGLINIKDLFFRSPPLKNVVDAKRDIMYIPEGMPVDQLLAEFQKRHQHLAVVLDEYGGTAGLVTMEDILEELVGEIQDEFDEEEPLMVRQEDGSTLVNGIVLLDEAAREFELDLDEEEEDDYNTLAGFVFGKLGKRPREGDSIIQGDFKVEVARMEGLRIGWLLLSPLPKPVPESNEEKII
ncbi:MAG TPA: hemolysin family protein [Syntrophomonadaceae bacterium]|nr:hemolysin family protein [Syntrophomonadaceae bacterium]